MEQGDKVRIGLVVAYDGTDFFGFQSQLGTGLPTVQDSLEAAIYRLTGEKVTVEGSGRTDTGVHAWGQVVHFQTAATIPAQRWKLALPPYLPESIVIRESFAADPDFHARFSAQAKTYLYQFYCRPLPSPFWRRYAYHVPYELDVPAMAAAARHFEGVHDFRGFCAAGAKVSSYVREIYTCCLKTGGDLPDWDQATPHQPLCQAPAGWCLVQGPTDQGKTRPDQSGPAGQKDDLRGDFAAFAGQEEALLRLAVRGSGFLWNMVRIIAGTLLEVGAGKRRAGDIPFLLGLGDRRQTGITLPPQGLFLYDVEYGEGFDLLGDQKLGRLNRKAQSPN